MVASRTDDLTSRLGEASSARTDTSPAIGAAEVGAALGRYQLGERIGDGAMGTVFRAFDPRLHRWVAVKVVSVDRWRGDQRRRALREAQALARLDHPNVVEVYDVGLERNWVYIVMELVEGDSLAHWLRRIQPPWRAVAQIFLGAGRGLAAAHAAGIVHRDVKPGNLVVGATGEVKLVDFGIARLDAGPLDSPGPELCSPGGVATLGDDTTVGTLLGTPRYMAPEQFRGGHATPHSDQYAFCVSLYESLYGVSAFDAPEREQLIRAKLDERLVAPPPDHGLPAGLETILRRGMSAVPTSRWPSMSALIRALEQILHPRGRPWMLVGLGIGVGLSTLMVLDRPSDCADASEAIARAWSPERERAIADAFAAVGSTFAADTWALSKPRLDARAEEWSHAFEAACLARATRSDVDPRTERRLLCLDAELERFRLLTERLAIADLETVRHAVTAIDALQPDRCGAGDIADAHDSSSAAAWARIAELRTLLDTGRPAEARAVATDTMAGIREVPSGIARSELALASARAAHQFGNLEPATQWYELAFRDSASADHDALAFEAALGLVAVLGTDGDDVEAGFGWARHAEALLGRLGRPPALDAMYLESVGLLELRSGRSAEATHHLRDALQLRLETSPADDLDVAGVHNNLAMALEARGLYEEALVEHQRALEIREVALGPDHPAVAASHNNLGVVYLAQDRSALARAELRTARTLWEDALGPLHPDVSLALNNLGRLANQEARFEEAASFYTDALAIMEKARGPDSTGVATACHNLASAYLNLGRFDEALALDERALTILVGAYGERHPHVALTMAGIATALESSDRYADARAMRERALEVQRLIGGENHPETAMFIADLAGNLRHTGERKRAIVLYEEAIAIVEATLGSEHTELARHLTNLGSTLGDAGRTDEAIAVLHRALTIVEKAHGPDHFFVGYPLRALATVHRARGDVDAARATLTRAVEVWAAAPSPPPDLADVRNELAEL